jgi:hypothetical protein
MITYAGSTMKILTTIVGRVYLTIPSSHSVNDNDEEDCESRESRSHTNLIPISSSPYPEGVRRTCAEMKVSKLKCRVDVISYTPRRLPFWKEVSHADLYNADDMESS